MRGYKKNKKSNKKLIIENQRIIDELITKLSELEKKYDYSIREKEIISNKFYNAQLELKSVNIKYENIMKNELKLKESYRSSYTRIKIEFKNVLNQVEKELKEFKVNYKSIESENKHLKKVYNDLNKKYEALSNSKLGSITLKYWMFIGGKK